MRSSVLLLLATGCVLTEAAPRRPRWRIDGEARYEASCVLGRAFVRKSGKQGIGIAVELKSTRDCRVQLDAVRLVWPDGSAIDRAGLAPLALRGRSLAYAWLPIEFDNNAAWNAGRTIADIDIAVTVDGRGEHWRFPMVQR